MKGGESMKCFADLHIHSTASDGILTPIQVIQAAQAQNLSYISIADHDTMLGVKELSNYLKTNQSPVKLIPAVEISADYYDEEIHILGYFARDHHQELEFALDELNQLRNQRIDKILEKLALNGIYISRHEVEQHSKIGTLGRPHIAKEMIQQGYVNTVGEAFERYLARGKPAYVRREKMDPSGAIDLIKSCNGVAVWAHPGITKRPEEAIDMLLAYEIDGVELYHPYHTINFEIEWRSILEKNNLLITGGSDFHDFHDPPAIMGVKGISCSQVEKMHNLLAVKSL